MEKVKYKTEGKYEFYVPDTILYLAGNYHRDPAGDRFTILTREADGCMVGVHHRMPLILDKRNMEKWLFSEEEAVKLLTSSCKELEKNKKEAYQQMSLF